MTSTDLSPVRVEHPPWCTGTCRTTTTDGAVVEVVHEADLDTLHLGLHRGPVVVAVSRYEALGPDGGVARSGPDTVVLDGPDAVTVLTTTEATALTAVVAAACLVLGGGR